MQDKIIYVVYRIEAYSPSVLGIFDDENLAKIFSEKCNKAGLASVIDEEVLNPDYQIKLFYPCAEEKYGTT